MSRALVLALAAGALIVLTCGVVLYLTYGLTEGLPGNTRVEGLSDSAEVFIYRDRSASIRASSEEDAYASLGYLHVQNHAWSMVLWRRTSLGRLGEWFGDELLDLDRLTRRLQLARLARQEYESLPPKTRRLLDAYTRGVNAAFAEQKVQMSDELVVLEEDPERWQPWHSLAVERLFAWVSAAPPHPDSLRRAPLSMREFFEADRFLRRWLHLHGFENSSSWVLADSSGLNFFQRHVYGSSALPIYQEVSLEWPGSRPLTGATLIGTPFMPAGRTDNQAWSILLSSRIRVTRAAHDSSGAVPLHERIISADGREELLEIDPGSRGIYFEPARSLIPIRADTAIAAVGLVLDWSGLVNGSDIDSWMALQSGTTVPFRLFEGDGILLTRGGSATVLGNPLVHTSPGGGLFISNSPWERYASERLDTLVRTSSGSINPARVRSDEQSVWAQRLAPSLIRSAIGVPDQSSPVAEALAFLRNWDFSYDRASIAASIFDTWITVYRDSLHHLPEVAVPDSMLEEHLLRYELLVKAVRQLRKRFGDNLSQWRWEQVQRKTYRFPVWSADTLLAVDAGALPRTRYAAIEIPGFGHPSTSAWGPSSVESDLISPAEWSGWISTDDWETFHYHARRFPANAFFGRYLVSPRNPDPAAIAAGEPARTIQLIPR